MMTSEWFAYPNPALASSWCSTGDAGACSDAENHRQSGRQDRRPNKSPKQRITQIGCLVFDDLGSWPQPAPSTMPSSQAKSP
jgi:hypothetical protein